MMTYAERDGFWQARLADYAASGLPEREWCKKNGFRMDQLRYWLSKFKEPQQSRPWACVKLIDDDPVSDRANLPLASVKSNETAMLNANVTVRIGAACIEVRPGFDQLLLSDVLRVVVATC